MARELTPQRTTPPTQNDLRKALATIDALVVNFERLDDWRKELQNKSTTENNEIVAAFEKQFENLFSRLNRLEAKIKEIDKKVNGRSATASPLKVTNIEDGGDNA